MALSQSHRSTTWSRKSFKRSCTVRSYLYPIPPCHTIHLQFSPTHNRWALNPTFRGWQIRGTPFVHRPPDVGNSPSDHSLSARPSPIIFQQPNPQQTPQQIPQYMPVTATAPVPIPGSSAQPVAYIQQPLQAAQSLPVYIQQPQPSRYASSSYTSGYNYGYGTPASTQYPPGSVGGSYTFVQNRSPSPRGHHDHRHRCGHRHHHGHRWFSHHRHRTHSDPEYDYRYRRY